MQDSKKDWEEQSAIMGDIYRYSTLNIAAISAVDRTRGIFFSRDPKLVQPLQVSARWPLNNVSQSRKRYNIFIHLPFSILLDMAPLNNRGWVLQERLLSTRIVHCHKEQLLWECKELLATETYPGGIREWISQLSYPENRVITRLDQSHAGGHENNVERSALLYMTWLGLVTQYSTCNLTREEDTLVAISGLAKVFQTKLEDEYLAGLWKGDAVFGLLWYTVPESHGLVSPDGPMRRETY